MLSLVVNLGTNKNFPSSILGSASDLCHFIDMTVVHVHLDLDSKPRWINIWAKSQFSVWKSNFENSLSKIFLFLFSQIESELNSPDHARSISLFPDRFLTHNWNIWPRLIRTWTTGLASVHHLRDPTKWYINFNTNIIRFLLIKSGTMKLGSNYKILQVQVQMNPLKKLNILLHSKWQNAKRDPVFSIPGSTTRGGRAVTVPTNNNKSCHQWSCVQYSWVYDQGRESRDCSQKQ